MLVKTYQIISFALDVEEIFYYPVINHTKTLLSEKEKIPVDQITIKLKVKYFEPTAENYQIIYDYIYNAIVLDHQKWYPNASQFTYQKFFNLEKLSGGLENARLKMLNYLKVGSDTASYYPSSLIFLFNELVAAGFLNILDPNNSEYLLYFDVYTKWITYAIDVLTNWLGFKICNYHHSHEFYEKIHDIAHLNQANVTLAENQTVGIKNNELADLYADLWINIINDTVLITEVNN
ncbi:hypothetical protein [Spiroplasma sp. DGKH1]|uniref:hypothetical protein n=1 Tax=Spiroplasma sp. DGKH1 TaxID=3050074 RepID=UPI0034C663ED